MLVIEYDSSGRLRADYVKNGKVAVSFNNITAEEARGHIARFMRRRSESWRKKSLKKIYTKSHPGPLDGMDDNRSTSIYW